MKTAIAVPDSVFERVERKVKDLGVSRSEFFSRAAALYLDELDRSGLTSRIDAAVMAAPVALRESQDWTKAGRASLEAATAEDEW
jgi:metal-responsive CopG/Arc/MetJ family transcriptional regulator